MIAAVVAAPHAATSRAVAASTSVAGGAASLAADQVAQPARFQSGAGPWLTIPGSLGPGGAALPGTGRRVVLISGDEEYRSEEALPQLAAILARRHGFTCRVLFAIDPDTRRINPDLRSSLPGLEALAEADLMVIATRFRDLPDPSMAHIDAYVRSGRPIVGLRTATHAFAPRAGSAYAGYGWNHDGPDWPQGFGRAILGETWIAHHGRHGAEATRGLIAAEAVARPIVRGIADGDVFGDTDVYRVRLPLPEDCRPVVLGEIVAGLAPGDPAAADDRNDPMMPIAWTRRMRLDEAAGLAGSAESAGAARTAAAAGRPVERRVFATTMGAATDFLNEGTRRLFVHGVYWSLGLEDAIPADGADVAIVGRYTPTAYGFGGARRDLRPADLAPPAVTATGARAGESSPAAGADDDSGVERDRFGSIDGPLRFGDGETLVLVGNTFAETLARSGGFAAFAHAAHPGSGLRVRQLPWSGDEAGLRPREVNVPTVRDWIGELDADAVVACFGMVESFRGPAGLDGFRRDLNAFIDMVHETRPADSPAVILVEPIVPEDLGAPWPTGAALAARRRDVAAYGAAMRQVAATHGVRVVGWPERRGEGAVPAGTVPVPRTSNGIHPTERGAMLFAGEIAESLGWMPDGTVAAAESGAGGTAGEDPARRTAADGVRHLAVDVHHLFRQRFRPTNTEYVWGRRRDPYGSVSFPPEQAQLDRMMAARDAAIAALDPAPAPADLLAVLPAPGAETAWSRAPVAGRLAADDWTPPAVVPKGTETSLGSTDIADPETFARSFTVASGWAVSCFASEATIPELANPLAMDFDDRGRLWVLCAPTYPHPMPGTPPASRLLILEDTDGDGAADRSIVYADDLSTPTGFAIDGRDVYVGEAPDLLRYRDLDGDDVADRRDIVATGFGMPDSHHQISAFTWAPGGGLLMHEGVFTVSAVETPWGVERTRDAAIWHFDPRTGRFDVLSHSGFANPWGHSFDDFGQSFLADASGGANFPFSQVISAFTWPHKPRRPGQFLNRGRPTAGAVLLSGRHVPPADLGSVLVNQSIGFHGTRWDQVVSEPQTSGYRAESRPEDLIASSDVNFRPVAIDQGPDGAVWIVDWCNPIIGHMQYSIRDPRRDASHGRIWRLHHVARPLVDPPEVERATVPELLDLLRIPERSTRDRVRRRLQRTDPVVLAPAAAAWMSEAAARHAMVADPDHERLRLEHLWLQQAQGRIEDAVLDAALGAIDGRVRAGAVRVIRHGLEDGSMAAGPAAERLAAAVGDPDMRVRLEAVVACGFLPAARGESIAVRAVDEPMDGPLFTVLEATLEHLGRGRPASGGLVRRLRLRRAPAAELAAQPLDAVTAAVRLGRLDLPVADREAAIAHLAAESGGGAGDVLVDALEAALTPAEAQAIGERLASGDAARLAPVRERLRAIAADPASGRARRVAAIAGGLRAAGSAGEALALSSGVAASELVAAVAALPPGTAEAGVLRRVRNEMALGRVAAGPAVAAVVRHGVDGDDPAATEAWLERLVAVAADVPLRRWSIVHEAAMAAARELEARRAPAATGSGTAAGDKELAARIDRGRSVYRDEAVGCLRCHGMDGQGAGGYPRLDRSPWVVGDPRRAAAIVVHGLHGTLDMPGQGRFASVMAPLGGSLDDAEIAAVLTYVRRSWGNHAPPVSEAEVAAGRAASPPNGGTWSVEAILERYPMRTETLVRGPRP